MTISSPPILRISYILLAGILLVLSLGCPPDPPPSPDNTEVNRVGEKKLGEENQVWINANSTTTNNSFYLNSDTDTTKVISFEIERDEVNSLLKTANNTTSGDSSLRLRIFLALDSIIKLPPATSQPIFRPFLNLATLNEKDTTFKSEISFEMDYLQMDIISYLDSLLKVLPEKRINPETALRLITAWDTLDRNKINTEMYEESSAPKRQERVRYFTFNRSDTYQALSKLKEKKKDLLYLHLGINNNPSDTIPFCTILHVDNPANFEDFKRVDLNDPPLFEFSAPCPKYCGNEDTAN